MADENENPYRFYEEATLYLEGTLREALNDVEFKRDSTEAITRRLEYSLRHVRRLLDKFANS